MRKLLSTIKKMVAFGLAAALLVAPVCGGTVYAKSKTASAVKIDKKHFPDKAFRTYIKTEFDQNKDGELSRTEIAKVSEIYVEYTEIRSFKGIGYFTELTSLYCRGHQLKTLDVSKNKKLKSLDCGMNELEKLNVSKNTKLESLSCQYNPLAGLDVSKNKKLENLLCFDCGLKKLDVSKNTKLLTLECSGNKLTSLDVSKNAKLQSLLCYQNGLKKLDVSKNVELTTLDCGYNNLTTLDLSKNTKLTSLTCSYNNLTTLDVSNCNLYECGCDADVELIGYTRRSDDDL